VLETVGDDPYSQDWGEPPYRLEDWPDGWVDAVVDETCRFWRKSSHGIGRAQFCFEYHAGKRFMPSDGLDSACT